MRNNCLIGIALMLTLSSCEEREPHQKIVIPEQQIPFTFQRFDHDLRNTDFSDASAARQQLYQRYGGFFCHFVEDILRIGPCEDPASTAELEGFVNWPDMLELQEEIDKLYDEKRMNGLNNAFQRAISRWHYFFPDSVIPKVVYMNSGLNYSAFCTDSVFATGLDYFLGADNVVMQKLPVDLFPAYLREDMHPDYAVPNTVKDFCQREISQSVPFADRPDMLSLLCFHGKVLYMMDLLLPETPDSVKMNWTQTQMEWARNNEINTWKELANQEVMFSTSMRSNVRWFDFGPFTNAGRVPQDSPPQLGIWMGWNIVRAYMRSHPETSIQQLLSGTPDRTLLQSYKPKN